MIKRISSLAGPAHAGNALNVVRQFGKADQILIKGDSFISTQSVFRFKVNQFFEDDGVPGWIRWCKVFNSRLFSGSKLLLETFDQHQGVGRVEVPQTTFLGRESPPDEMSI